MSYTVWYRSHNGDNLVTSGLTAQQANDVIEELDFLGFYAWYEED